MASYTLTAAVDDANALAMALQFCGEPGGLDAWSGVALRRLRRLNEAAAKIWPNAALGANVSLLPLGFDVSAPPVLSVVEALTAAQPEGVVG